MKGMQASADERRAVAKRENANDAGDRLPPPPAAEYVSHVVERGETLIGLARRYGTSADVLRQLNQLTSDDIKRGQKLRVPRVDSLP